MASIAPAFDLPGLQPAKGSHEIGDRRADLSRTVFLNEMDALHRDFRLIGPCAAKLALAPWSSAPGSERKYNFGTWLCASH